MRSWHRLLAPLPDDAVVRIQPVVDPSTLPESSPIAGWQQGTCLLSAGEEGIRHLLVTLDATGRPNSAVDHVLHCRPAGGSPPLTRCEHASVGGRLEEDGTFLGTYHWMVFVRPEDSDEEVPPVEASSRPPTPDEIAQLKSLVRHLTERGASG